MVGVKIRVHDSEGRIRPGMAADVKLAAVKAKENQ
jgi:hypothetical protein